MRGGRTPELSPAAKRSIKQHPGAYACYIIGLTPEKLQRKSRSVVHDRVRLDLHQHLRIDQSADLDHWGRRADVVKKLVVCPPDLLPSGDVGYEHAGPYDVPQFSPGALQNKA